MIAGLSGTGNSHFTEGLTQGSTENGLPVSWFTLETLSAAIGSRRSTGPPHGPSHDLPRGPHRHRRHRPAARRGRRH
ncbi:hypothetical protein [Streptomyces sp. NPDC048419]|uniref:hypothetical protein n=1 Tax=Streptomyces sp. NPDC048419 TaxID=3365547 RepID=UPI0037126C30